MAAYQGDFQSGAGVSIIFATINTAGTPTAMTSGVVQVFRDTTSTGTTVGVTLTTTFGGLIGCNLVQIACTNVFYSTGSNFNVVLTDGTVSGVTMAGYAVGAFSLENRVVNWAKVGGPATTQNLSGTTFGTVSTVSDKAGYTAATVSDKTGYALSAAGIGSIWDETKTGHTTASTFGLFVDAAVTTRLAPTTAGRTLDVDAAGGAEVGSFQAGAITNAAFAAGAIDAAAIAANAVGASELAADAANEIADATLARNVAGGSSTGRTVSESLYVLRNKVDIGGGLMTVYGTDDTTVAFTAVVTTTAAVSIITIDPT